MSRPRRWGHVAVRMAGSLCVGIPSYNDEKPKPGPTNLFNITTHRLTITGLIVGDWLDLQSEFDAEVGGYFRAGKLKSLETVAPCRIGWASWVLSRRWEPCRSVAWAISWPMTAAKPGSVRVIGRMPL